MYVCVYLNHDEYYHQNRATLLTMYMPKQISCRSSQPTLITPSMSQNVCTHSPAPTSPASITLSPVMIEKACHIPLPTNSDHDVRVPSILDTLLSVSRLLTAFVPPAFADLLRADRDAASICFLVCWCMVREYAERENCPSMSSYSCVGS